MGLSVGAQAPPRLAAAGCWRVDAAVAAEERVEVELHEPSRLQQCGLGGADGGEHLVGRHTSVEHVAEPPCERLFRDIALGL